MRPTSIRIKCERDETSPAIAALDVSEGESVEETEGDEAVMQWCQARESTVEVMQWGGR
jgi:hypothetical protein